MGSRLYERHLSEGYHLTCMDNPRTGPSENDTYLREEEDFDYIDHDTTTHANFERMGILSASALGASALGLRSAQSVIDFMLVFSSKVYGDLLVNFRTEDFWDKQARIVRVGPELQTVALSSGKGKQPRLIESVRRNFATRDFDDALSLDSVIQRRTSVTAGGIECAAPSSLGPVHRRAKEECPCAA